MLPYVYTHPYTHIHTIVDIHSGKEHERAVILERLWVLSVVGLSLEGVYGEECTSVSVDV